MPLGSGSAQTPKRSRPRQPPWVVFAVVGLVAIILGVSTGLLLVRTGNNGGTGPSDTVLRFYQAIHDSKAQAALAELATTPADTSLITDSVLRVSQETAPMTELTVPPTSSTVVQVTYRQGGELVTDRVSVKAVGNGYKIITPPNAGGIPLTAIQRPGVTLFIANQEVKQTSVMLLPGVYPVRSTSKFLAYGGGTLSVKRIDDSGNAAELAPKVTTEGVDAVKRATVDSLAACTKVKSFQPPQCPFRYTGPSANTVDPAQSSWEIVGDPTNDLTLTLGSNPTKVEMQTNFVARITFPAGVPAFEIPTNGARATVDLTQPKPVITWTV